MNRKEINFYEVFQSEYDLGEIVYLVTDEDQKPRIVTKIMFVSGGGIQYALGSGALETWQYVDEISRDKNYKI